MHSFFFTREKKPHLPLFQCLLFSNVFLFIYINSFHFGKKEAMNESAHFSRHFCWDPPLGGSTDVSPFETSPGLEGDFRQQLGEDFGDRLGTERPQADRNSRTVDARVEVFGVKTSEVSKKKTCCPPVSSPKGVWRRSWKFWKNLVRTLFSSGRSPRGWPGVKDLTPRTSWKLGGHFLEGSNEGQLQLPEKQKTLRGLRCWAMNQKNWLFLGYIGDAQLPSYVGIIS